MEVVALCLLCLLIGVMVGTALGVSYQPPVADLLEWAEPPLPFPTQDEANETPVESSSWPQRMRERLAAVTQKPLPLDQQTVLYRDKETGMTSMLTLKEAQERENQRLDREKEDERRFVDQYCDGLAPLE